jgi:hypothetical protein
VRASTDERDARAVWIETICDRLGAHPVQQIGKIFVIYRENPKEEKKARGMRREGQVEGDTDGGSEKKRGKGTTRPSSLEPRASTRTSHRQSRTPSPRPASEPRRRRPRTSR